MIVTFISIRQGRNELKIGGCRRIMSENVSGPVDDDDERDFLNRIGTNLDLSDEQVDRLIAAARKVLRESQDFQSFLKLEKPGSDP